LAGLGKRTLSPKRYAEPSHHSLGLLDSTAGDVFEAIADKGIQVPSALQVPTGRSTVYHTRELTSEEMQKLRDVGFREVGIIDSSGSTPFILAARNSTYMKVVKVCEWLISKGAKPLKEVTDSGAVQIHHFSAQWHI